MSGFGAPSGSDPTGPGYPGPRRGGAAALASSVVPGLILALVIALTVWVVQVWQQSEVISGVASGAPAGAPAAAPVAPGSGSAPGSGPLGAPIAEDDASQIASRVSPGLVDITTTLGYANQQAAGTGILLTPGGEVLTNNHVIAGATDIAVTDIGSGRSYPATVVGYDRSHDIAVIQLEGASGLTTPALGDSSRVRTGDAVLAIGNAGGVGGSPSVAPGTITGLGRSVTARDEADSSQEQLTGLIQVGADVQAGDSGGPLVNSAGEIIGVVTAASTGFDVQQSGGEGFAIPINQARTIVHQIETGAGSSTIHLGPTPILGIRVQDVAVTTRHRHRQVGQVSAGALVSGVFAGSPAEQAGLSVGSVITSLDGQTVDSTTTLSDLLGRHHPGDRVELGWVDTDGQPQTATVPLITGPAA